MICAKNDNSLINIAKFNINYSNKIKNSTSKKICLMFIVL